MDPRINPIEAPLTSTKVEPEACRRAVMLLPIAITSSFSLLNARLPETCTKSPTVAERPTTETAVTPLLSAKV